MIKPDGDMGEADESDLDEEYSKTGGAGDGEGASRTTYYEIIDFCLWYSRAS